MHRQPYSPDLQITKAPSDYYLFSHLQLHLDGTSFRSNNEVERFLDACTPQFLTEGIEKLSKYWQTIVDLNGDYYTH
ncbi:UNVERIFIED_CONTAM: Histone-lysine N-methyltransferase SETMAR [Trichonephila clavipes]